MPWSIKLISYRNKQQKKQESGFWGNQAEAVAGAVFLALNITATEEPVMMACQSTAWQSLALMILSLLLVFGVTYAMEFRGGIRASEQTRWWHIFFKDSVCTYTTALLVAGGSLFLFDRINVDTGLLPTIQMIVTLGFATALGAAFARLLI